MLNGIPALSLFFSFPIKEYLAAKQKKQINTLFILTLLTLFL